MSHVALLLAIALAQAWVRLYTAGLRPNVRDGRRAEIASDLWEQQQAASVLENRSGGTALQVLARVLLGVPADLSWRVTAGRMRRVDSLPERRVRMNRSLAQKGFLVVALLLTAFYLFLGVSNALINQEPTFVERFGAFWGGVLGSLIGFIPAALIAAGLWLQRRAPVRGGILVLVAAVPVAVGMYWTVFGPLLALLLVVFWISRTRRLARERKPPVTA